MTKLNGTSGQVFSGLAESLTMRGASRSAKSAGTKPQADASFNDLLHTVSNLAKRALNDQETGSDVKAGPLRARVLSAEKDEATDKMRHRDLDAADQPKSLDKLSDKSSEKQASADLAAKAELPNRSSTPAIVGPDLAAMPAVKPQLQMQSRDKDAPEREDRSAAARRNVAQAGVASSTSVPTTARAPAAAQASAAAQTTSAPGSEANAKAGSAIPGFEAVIANVERAGKASVREALPEATKVTVLQQETHLPPVQLSPPQQVADAAIAELKETPAAVGSAPADPATSQGNAPDQPLKILTITLEPPALGNVTVRLRLVGTEVSVHLAAARKDTSQMLDQQRDSIRELMQSAGYVADVAPVQHGSLDGFQNGSGQSQPSGQQQPSSQSQGTFDGSSSSSGQSDGGARQAKQERQSNQETRHDQDLGPHPRRGPVYL
jgi:chemotaxis protein MotD